MSTCFDICVIPAQAGIHLLMVPVVNCISWTPAFAAVTMASEGASA